MTPIAVVRGLESNRTVSSTSGLVVNYPGFSEVKLRPESQNTRIEGRFELAEVARAKVVAHGIELRVVPGVERLKPELQPAAASFAQDKALEQREVPVVTTRSMLICSALTDPFFEFATDALRSVALAP
jgi:hypothetical protein